MIRYHDGDITHIEGVFDSDNKTFTFKSDKFSPYIMAYKDTKKEELNTSSTKVVTCEEAMNSKDWVWSETKKACVYKVSDTSVN